MRKLLFSVVASVVSSVALSWAGDFQPGALPFALTDVRLLDGPFKHAMELDRAYLLSLDVDRLLHTFRVNAGIPSTAQPLGGWEEPNCELRGHFVGHYLTACALMYASTGDERFKERGNKVVAGLAECQTRLGSGYLSAFPESFIDRVEAAQRVWAPWYTLHKIVAGLLDMHEHCGNATALEMAKRFADWSKGRADKLSGDEMQRMLVNEHGGINEAYANLYAATNDRAHLELSLRFNHAAVIDPAARGEDRLTGLHANTQIPKFIGTARQYELAGEGRLRAASEFFWNTVVKERSYVIGGHSDGEMFSPKERLSEALGPNTTETCNTYNVLKLTRHLFSWKPLAEYADYYERALYNHILCSQNPEDGMMCYYVPLRSGSRKQYSTPLGSFWCCTGTGIENHAKYGDSIYFHGGDRLFVNLFIASELSWKAKGLTLRQETRYPEEPRSRLSFTCKEPIAFDLAIRHPYWAASGFEVSVNGEKVPAASEPGSFRSIARTWRSGDVVTIEMPMTLRTESFRDNPRRFAFMHGPLVLCAEVDVAKPIPIVVTPDGRPPATELAPVAGKPSTFAGPPSIFRRPGEESGCAVTLEPFYKVHGPRHYVVYWDAYTSESWKAKQEEAAVEAARQKKLEERTVDAVKIGDAASEREHAFKGERTDAGEFGGRRWRHATEGGWFSYALKVLPGEPQELSVTYWGSDGGNRIFDILVEGQKVATQRLQENKPGSFFDAAYELPPAAIQGKHVITVTFKAHEGAWAGGVFGVRVLKKQ